MMDDVACPVLSNITLQDSYHKIIFDAPHIAASAKPGQFVHVEVDDTTEHVLRRPFSICDADAETGHLTLIYKVVGEGTAKLAKKPAGETCRILGPLGTAYQYKDDVFPVIAAGGFGSVSTMFLAKKTPRPGIIFMGARSKHDVLLVEEYRKLGWQVEIATDDGSEGFHGLITTLLLNHTNDFPAETKIFGCGPAPMLYALIKTVAPLKFPCDVSMEQHMGCGVGACFACVIKVKDPTSPDGWRYSRSCKEGVVYPSTEVYCG